jgi:ABC-type lipoprotein release transport system permease subunit
MARMVEFFLAKKYLFHNKNGLLHIVSAVAVAGIALGVATLIVVVAVNNGFLGVFRERILEVYPHVVVMKRFEPFTDYPAVEKRLAALPEVAAVSHATYDEMMLSAGTRNRGVLIKGIDPDAPLYRGKLTPYLQGGTLDALREEPRAEVQGERVVLSGLVQGGVYRLLVTGPGPGTRAVVLPEDTTAPPPASCRLRGLSLASPPEPLRALGEEEAAWELSPVRGVDLDAGDYSVAGADFTCRSGESVLAVAGDGGVAFLLQPRLERALHKAQLVVEARGGAALGVAFGESGAQAVVEPGQPAVLQDDGKLPSLFAGVTLASQLDVKPGDVVTLLSPLRGLEGRESAPFGMAPTAQRFQVAGLLRTDFNEFDQRLVVTAYDWVTRFQNQGDEPRWVEVQLRRPDLLEEGVEAVRASLEPWGLVDFLEGVLRLAGRTREMADLPSVVGEIDPGHGLPEYLAASTRVVNLLKFEDLGFGRRDRYRIIDWEEMNKNLFSSLTLQKMALALFFLIIVIIASFSIVSTQLLLLGNKLPDIAILRSMGARRLSVARVFTLHGLILAVSGVALGLGLGSGALALLERVHFELDPAVYLISYLPVEPRVGEVAAIAALALLFAAATVRLGSAYAASRNPIDALRLKK